MQVRSSNPGNLVCLLRSKNVEHSCSSHGSCYFNFYWPRLFPAEIFIFPLIFNQVLLIGRLSAKFLKAPNLFAILIRWYFINSTPYSFLTLNFSTITRAYRPLTYRQSLPNLCNDKLVITTTSAQLENSTPIILHCTSVKMWQIWVWGSSHQKTPKSVLWMSSVWEHCAIESFILRCGKVYYYSDTISITISFWSFVLNGQFENILSWGMRIKNSNIQSGNS